VFSGSNVTDSGQTDRWAARVKVLAQGNKEPGRCSNTHQAGKPSTTSPMF